VGLSDLSARVPETSAWLLIATFRPANEADAGTRTPDPIITSYRRCAREGAWLSQIALRNPFCVPRVCHFRFGIVGAGVELPDLSEIIDLSPAEAR
jgi:hypothetical protein